MTVHLERPADHVAELVMERPPANAISTGQAERFIELFDQIAADLTVRAVVLSSAVAKAFSAGADLKERNGFTESQLGAQREIFRRCFADLRGLPMPVIAAVDGYAMGGGFELALGCDLIVAGADASFALPEIGVGVIPGGGGTQLLSRRVGLNRAADLILTCRRVGAAEARELGFADRSVESGRAAATARELAEVIASKSPIGARAAKRALNDGFDASLAEGMQLEHQGWEEVAFSPDRIEGIAAFNDKRQPRWSDPSAR